jgi:hypothetical protein
MSITPSAQAEKCWNLTVAEHAFSSDEYTLTLFLADGKQLELPLQKSVQGQERAVMLNGALVATMDEPHSWSHSRREDVVYVAPGMDIAVAIGAAWCYYDKQSEQSHRAAAGAGSQDSQKEEPGKGGEEGMIRC